MNEEEFLSQLRKANELAKSMDEATRLKLLSSSKSYITDLLYDYYTNPILEDGELLRYIEGHRVGKIPRSGTGGIDWIEISFLMKAYKSFQYRRFMYHILRRYLFEYFPVSGTGERECCICWRKVKETNGSVDMDTALSSSNTQTSICPHCLMNLMEFSKLLETLNDEKLIEIKKGVEYETKRNRGEE